MAEGVFVGLSHCSLTSPRMEPRLKPFARTLKSKSTEQPSPLAELRSTVARVESELELHPCVAYISDKTFKPTYISPNSRELLGITAEQFVGKVDVWEKIIPAVDREIVFAKFSELKCAGEASCVHRIINGSGLPVWVSHHLKAIVNDSMQWSLHGLMVPISANSLSESLDPSTIATFIHKLGNQFQLMNLAFNSLRKGTPGGRDVNVVQDALDSAIGTTRAFSEYSQVPASISEVRFSDVVEAAITAQSSVFIDHQIEIEREYSEKANGMTIKGDPHLLELAVSAILQNAVEASNRGGKIKIGLAVHSPAGRHAGLKLVVADYGVGIAEGNLPKVVFPFFTTKANHDGLGLSMACRFVEMHRGFLNITSALQKGSQVQMILPFDGNIGDGCH